MLQRTTFYNQQLYTKVILITESRLQTNIDYSEIVFNAFV